MSTLMSPDPKTCNTLAQTRDLKDCWGCLGRSSTFIQAMRSGYSSFQQSWTGGSGGYSSDNGCGYYLDEYEQGSEDE